MTDCIVVGGGLIGMLSARELKKAGLDVLLIEKGQLGHESSWAGGGILSPLHPWRYPDAVNELAIEGHRGYADFAEEIYREGGVDPEYNRCGMLVVESDEVKQATDWSRQWGMKLEVLSGSDTLQAVLPGINPKYQQGLWLPEIAQMRNPRLVKALRASLDALGVNYLENTQVERLEVEKQQIKGVVAGGKTYHSDKVLIAGGAWSSELLKPYVSPPAIEPVKGQMVLFKAEPGLVKSMLLADSRYLIPRKDGRILCGSTIEHTGYQKETTEQAREMLQQKAIELFPALQRYPIEHHWAGLRPGSPDGIPTIEKSAEIRGLFVNAGHFRNGVILGLASARRVSRLIQAG